jgi:two-component system, chemotaxis family, protein-glutamate methylesterase/glutaminase
MRTLPDDFSHDADLVVVGASAGGVEALLNLFGKLAPPLHAAIVVVLHVPEDPDSVLAQLFGTRLQVPVEEARPHAPVQPGRIYFAPPGYHLLVEADRTFSLSCEPPVQFSRPSIDVLFESAAESFGARLLGIVLTGANEDGAQGLAQVKACGGLTAVQEPDEAVHATMPEAAIRVAAPAYVLPLAGLHRLLQTVVGQ